MKEQYKKTAEILIFIFPPFLAGFELLLAGLWAKRGAWITAGGCVFGSLVWAMIFCVVLACFFFGRKLDQRFDRLETVLKEQREHREKERQKDGEQNEKQQADAKQNPNEPKGDKSSGA